MITSLLRSLRHWYAWLLMLAALFIVALLAVTIAQQPPGSVDLVITRSIQRLSPSWLGAMLAAVSAWGYQPTGVLGTLAGGVLVGRWLGWRSGLYLVGATVIQGGLNHLIKTLVARPRPTIDLVNVVHAVAGLSFPSGHVMFYTVFFGLVAWMAWRFGRGRWRRLVILLCLGMIAAVGLSRLYLGAHWASDVIAAYLLSGVILWLAILGYERWLSATHGRPDDLDELPPIQESEEASWS